MGIAHFYAIPTAEFRPLNASFPECVPNIYTLNVFGRVPASFFRRLPRLSGYDLKSTEKLLDFPSCVFLSKCSQNHAMTSATGFLRLFLANTSLIIDDEFDAKGIPCALFFKNHDIKRLRPFRSEPQIFYAILFTWEHQASIEARFVYGCRYSPPPR